MIKIFDFIKKFLSGFNVSSSAVIGKWLFYAIVFLVFTTAYNHFNPKQPSLSSPITAEKIEKIINEAPKPENKKQFFLGITIKGFGLGLFKE